MKVSGLTARHRPVKGSINIVLTFDLECGDRKVSRRVEVKEEGPQLSMNPGEKWRIPYGDAKDSVLILVFGTSNVKVERKTSLDRHIEWAAEQLRKRLRQRVRQALRTKAMTERVEKRKSKEERAEMMRALHKDLLELIRRYPRIRKQDVTDAFDRARNMDTVCRVMED